MKLFTVYIARWILSGFIMLPFFYLFRDYLELTLWKNVLASQVVGAFIFFQIDKYIFKGENE